MKKLTTSTAIAALVAATLGTAALTPVAFAQEGPRAAGPGAQMEQNHRGPGAGKKQMQRRPGGERMGGPGLLALVCSERGAAQLERVFTGLSRRVELTTEQQPLFDALKTAALTSQTEFADTCATLRPSGQRAQRPNLVERLQSGIKLGEARTAALSEVLPSLEAFYGSLTDEQKARLEPRQRNKGERQGNRRNDRRAPAEAAPGLDG